MSSGIKEFRTFLGAWDHAFLPRLPMSGREEAQPPLGAGGYPTRRGGRPPQHSPLASSATRRAPAAAGPGHMESSPSSSLGFRSPKPQIITGGHRQYVGLASLLPQAWSTALTHQRLLTCVYAVSQRDFSFEFRLRDYFSGRISVQEDSHTHASHALDSAMRLGEKAAPPRTPEQLAELGKYSGRSLQAG